MEREKDLVWNDRLSSLLCALEGQRSWVGCCKISRLLESYIHSQVRAVIAEPKKKKKIMRSK